MADTIQEFLVKLGYQIDQSQQNRFNDGLKQTHEQMNSLQVVLANSIRSFYELATAAGGTALAIAAALGKIAMNMAGISFQAQRVGASVETIHALRYAFTQAGGSAEDAQASLEAYANTLRNIPGLEQSIKQEYGVTATDHAEQLAQIGTEMRRRIESAGPAGSQSRANMTALELAKAEKLLNISQQQALLMQRPELGPSYQQATGTANRIETNWDEAAKQGETYRHKLTEIRDEFSNLKTFVYGQWATDMNSGLTRFSDYLQAHDAQIASYLKHMRENFEGVGNSIDAWWKSLNEKQQGQVQTGAVVGAGAVVLGGGSAVLGSLLGKLGIESGPRIAGMMALGVAIAALTNDYETWKKTGGKEGLIDWTAWSPSIEKATTAVKSFNDDIIGPLADKLGVDRTFIPAFEALAGFLVGPMFIGRIKAGLGTLLQMLFFIPGSGVTGAVLGALGIAGAVAAYHSGFDTATAGEMDFTPDKIDDFGHPVGYRDKQGKYYSNQQIEDMQRTAGQAADLTISPAKRAVLDTIAGGESNGPDPYNAKNPTSTAQGRYQFIDGTWKDVSSKTGLTERTPENQDKNAWYLASTTYQSKTGRDLEADAREGGHEEQIAAALRAVWPSMPGGTQQNTTPEIFAARLHASLAANQRIAAGGRPEGPPPGTATGAIKQGQDLAHRFGEYLKGLDLKNEGQGYHVTQPGDQPDAALPSAPPSTPLNVIPSTPPPPPPSATPAMAGPSPITLNSTPNITVNGVSDPQLAANYVERSSERQNADVLRRLKSVYT